MEISFIKITVAGSEETARDVLRMLGEQLGVAVATSLVIRQPVDGESSPAPSAREPSATALPVTKGVTRGKQAQFKPAREVAQPKRPAPARPAASDDEPEAGSELAQQIVDFVRLHGPQSVPQLAVALRRHGAGIGKSVSASALLRKGSDGLVYVVD